MREFFRGWRRKVGVVTLVMAMLLAGVWLRSRSRSDYVMIQTPISNCLIVSGNERLLVLPGKLLTKQISFRDYTLTLDLQPIDHLNTKTIIIEWNSLPVSAVHVTPAPQPSPRPTYRVMFDWLIGDGQKTREMLPYWFPVLLLSSLSGYLILRKPQKAK